MKTKLVALPVIFIFLKITYSQHILPQYQDDLVRGLVRHQISELFSEDSSETTSSIANEADWKLIEDIITATVPHELRQDITTQLEPSQKDLESWNKLIRNHILIWSLQFAPENLQAEIAPVLEEYRVAGQISEGHETVALDVLQYLLYSQQESGRSTREFGSKLWAFVKKALRFVITLIVNRPL